MGSKQEGTPKWADRKVKHAPTQVGTKDMLTAPLSQVRGKLGNERQQISQEKKLWSQATYIEDWLKGFWLGYSSLVCCANIFSPRIFLTLAEEPKLYLQTGWLRDPVAQWRGAVISLTRSSVNPLDQESRIPLQRTWIVLVYKIYQS